MGAIPEGPGALWFLASLIAFFISSFVMSGKA